MYFVNGIYISNIADLCRVCLKESSQMKSLNSRLAEFNIIEPNVTHWTEVLSRILNTEIITTEEYPSLICTECIPLILAAYAFKVQYDKSHQILQYLSSYNNKKEYSSDVENTESDQEIKFNSNPPSTHSSPILHPCPICTEQFSALELRKHAHTHESFQKYLNIPEVCKIDPTISFYKTVKAKSNQTKVSDVPKVQDKLHNCWQCGEQFTAAALRKHILSHKNSFEFKCKDCPRTFRKLNHLNSHKVQHMKELPFKCEECGKGFIIQTNYECHMLTHNKSQELPHQCLRCSKRFSNPKHLRRHLTIHTENVSYNVKFRSFKCRICLQRFKSNAELSGHQCNQFEIANYSCKICKKVFKNASGVYNHNRNKHKLKGVKELCSVCGIYITDLDSHSAIHTGNKPYECETCGNRFLEKKRLRRHVLIHSVSKPFICSACGKGFNSIYNLQQHERIHIPNRFHICPLCGKRYLDRHQLVKHVGVHKTVNLTS